jgi:transposase
LLKGMPCSRRVIGGMLPARAALWHEFTRLHREMLKIARTDRVCQRLMSAPGVGALVAITYRSAIELNPKAAKVEPRDPVLGIGPGATRTCLSASAFQQKL